MQNNVLPSEPSGADGDPVAVRVARASLTGRESTYVDEVKSLMRAALEVMARSGGKARVVDIVTVAGLSNDAFYRHFPSKDALVTALLEDGTQRLAARLARRTAEAADAREAVRQWAVGLLGEADTDIAVITRAVLANGGGAGTALGRPFAVAPLAALLHAPLAELGSPTPELDATLCTHAVLGRLAEHLFHQTTPTPQEIDRVVAFCLRPAS